MSYPRSAFEKVSPALTEDNGFDPRDIAHELRAVSSRRRGLMKPGIRRTLKNFCPECGCYTPKNHIHSEVTK